MIPNRANGKLKVTMSGVTERMTIDADGFEGKSCGILKLFACVGSFFSDSEVALPGADVSVVDGLGDLPQDLHRTRRLGDRQVESICEYAVGTERVGNSSFLLEAIDLLQACRMT